ncbi:MAG: GntR family transcriptional regulator [Microbacterium sp.]|nr:GntR family transcriptional regulator [Microbacterium sp.]
MTRTDAAADGSALADHVYRSLLRGIVDGTYPSRARLKEREISDRYEVSRIPVREALQRLESEGFVQSVPNRGVTVAPVTRADLEHVFELRLCIEPFAAGRAAERIANGEVDPAPLVQVMGELSAMHGDEADIPSLDFHEEVVRLSGNARLVRSLAPLRGRMEWQFRLTQDARAAEHAIEHQQIFEAVMAGRAAAASALSYAHIDLARGPMIAALAPLLDG